MLKQQLIRLLVVATQRRYYDFVRDESHTPSAPIAAVLGSPDLELLS